MKSGFQWVVSPIVAFKELVERYVFGIQISAYETLNTRKPEIVIWMQNNATWQDRTGNARAGLTVEIEQLQDFFNILFQHTVFYGEYLEYDFDGRYSILRPAIAFWTPILMKEIQAAINTKAAINV